MQCEIALHRMGRAASPMRCNRYKRTFELRRTPTKMWEALAGHFEQTPYLLETGPWWAVVIWLGAMGGCIGSFLNVVMLRVPQSEDIVFTPSQCPVCHHKIRRRHNLPILGYLLLRGRCYDCKTPIPARYWLWEVAFAALFVTLGIASPWL